MWEGEHKIYPIFYCERTRAKEINVLTREETYPAGDRWEAAFLLPVKGVLKRKKEMERETERGAGERRRIKEYLLMRILTMYTMY